MIYKIQLGILRRFVIISYVQRNWLDNLPKPMHSIIGGQNNSNSLVRIWLVSNGIQKACTLTLIIDAISNYKLF